MLTSVDTWVETSVVEVLTTVVMVTLVLTTFVCVDVLDTTTIRVVEMTVDSKE